MAFFFLLFVFGCKINYQNVTEKTNLAEWGNVVRLPSSNKLDQLDFKGFLDTHIIPLVQTKRDKCMDQF